MGPAAAIILGIGALCVAVPLAVGVTVRLSVRRNIRKNKYK